MDMQEVLSQVITKTNEIFEAEAGSVALLESGGQEIVIRAAVGAGADAVRGLSLPVSKGVIGRVASYPPKTARALSPTRPRLGLSFKKGTCKFKWRRIFRG